MTAVQCGPRIGALQMNFFSRLRIVHKIAAISGTGGLGLLIVAGIYFLGSSKQEQYGRVATDAQAIAELANKLHIKLLESRRAEKDFLLRNDIKYATRHEELARAVAADFDAIGKRIDDAGQIDLGQKVRSIHEGFKKYATHFATI